MSRKTPRILLAVVVGLVLALLVLQSNDRGDSGISGRPFLPDFSARADSMTELRVAASGDEVTVRRDSGDWVVSQRDDYPADIGKLRQLVVAIAGSRIIEEKTSNPEQYAKLGVDDPESGGSGSRVEIVGPDFSYAIVVGNRAQGESRYVRLADEATSLLIDRDPDAPASASDWLRPDIIDVGADRVRKVTISHADGETLVIEKSAEDLTDFTLLDIPDGREPSYATIGNSIAAALSKLTLEDVRKAAETPGGSTAVFETWDGLTIRVSAVTDDDSSWFSFEATATTGQAAGNDGDEDSANDNGISANQLNARLSGWQYEIPDYKKNQLTRRWEDVLKAVDGD